MELKELQVCIQETWVQGPAPAMTTDFEHVSVDSVPISAMGAAAPALPPNQYCSEEQKG